MPKIQVQPHLQFTDHWIRKRFAEAPAQGQNTIRREQ
jgi:hypothetical protein